MRQAFPDYMVPAQYVIRRRLRRTASGKTDRTKLAEAVGDIRPGCRCGSRLVARLQSTTDGVDLWIVFTDEVSEDLLSAYAPLLSPEERRRGANMSAVPPRRNHFITRALVRTVLSRYAAIGPAEWRFSRNEYGRPVIAPEQAANAPLTFNVSHTSGMVALVVRRMLAVGVDVEHIRCRTAPQEVADRYFSARETAALRLVAEARRYDRFLEHWTLKESYVKARGAGLSIPLDRFSVDLPSPSRVSLSISPCLGDTPARWRLWQLRPSREHVLALCAERAIRREALTIRRCVPLCSEGPLECAVYRDSLSEG